MTAYLKKKLDDLQNRFLLRELSRAEFQVQWETTHALLWIAQEQESKPL